MIGVQDASGKAGIARVGVQDAGGKSDIARISVLMPGGGDYLVFEAEGGAGSLTLSASPLNAFGANGSAADVVVETNSVTVTASGGSEPYSYAWTQITDPIDPPFSASAASSRTTTFVRQDVPAGVTIAGDFRCTVTDTRGRTGTIDITARVTNYGDIF